MRFDLSDQEWAVIEPLLPKGGRGPKRVDDRRVLNGIFYILRTGAPWRDRPVRGAGAAVPVDQRAVAVEGDGAEGSGVRHGAGFNSGKRRWKVAFGISLRGIFCLRHFPPGDFLPSAKKWCRL